MFIVFEGIDCSGKSTQARLLASHYDSVAVPYAQAYDPGSTAVGKTLRAMIESGQGGEPVPVSELLLFAAARVQMVEEIIKPALKAAKHVVCDRYSPSTLAYQAAQGLDIKTVKSVVEIAERGCTPDLYILLDIDPSIAADRLNKASLSRYEKKGLEFQETVRGNYLKQARSEPARWLVLDGNTDPRELNFAVVRRLGDVTAASYTPQAKDRG